MTKPLGGKSDQARADKASYIAWELKQLRGNMKPRRLAWLVILAIVHVAI